jgi:uncharacterized protein (UPF0297 family)
MRKIKVNFEVESLNLTFCIGNSLVHLQDKNEIKALIKDMYSTLKDKGTMVIQIINYDRIIRQNVKSLPTIDRSNEGVKFIRNYNHEEDESIIHFQAELIISKNGINETYKNSVPLVAIQSDELISMIREAGFKEIDVYGDFSKNEFSENSYALIVAAHK